MYTKKDIIRLLIPAFVEMFLTAAIGVVNTIMVSGVGDFAVSGVSLVDSINFVAVNLFMAVSTGATVIIAQQLGSGNEYKASKTASQSITAVVIISFLTGLFLYIFNTEIINFLFGNSEQVVKSAAKTYLICSAISYPLLGIFNIFTSILRANNNFRASMIAAVASNIVNVSVGAICIFVLGLGVLGAGIGMILARLFGPLILIRPLFKNPKIKISKLSYKMDLKVLKPVLYIGIPAGMDSLVFNGGKLLVQSLVASLGIVSLTANSIANSLNTIISIPGNAIAVVAVTVIGFYAGAGLKEEMKKMMKKFTVYSMLLLAGVSIIILPFAGSIIKLYSPTPQVIELALQVTHLTLICVPIFWSAAFILPSCLRSAGDVVFVTVISISSMWIIRVFGGYLLVKYTSLGLMGIWVAWCFDWVTRGAPFLGRFLSRKYEKHLPKI